MFVKPRVPILRPDHPLARGLAGFWALADGAGDRVCDASTNGNHGATVNAPSWAAGPRGDRLALVRASDQYVQVGNPATLQFTSDITVALHYRLASQPADGQVYQLFSKDNGTDRPWAMMVYRDDLTLSLSGVLWQLNGGDAGDRLAEQRTPQAGDERLAVGSYHQSSGLFRLYIDGVKVNEVTGPTGGMASTGADVQIGRRSSAGGQNPLDGSVDLAALWSRTLSDSEVSQLAADPFGVVRPRGWALVDFGAALAPQGGVGLVGPGLVGANPLISFGGLIR